MSAINSFIPDECASSCGKGSDGLKNCSACKQVKYCNATCQKAHRSRHKFECRKRVTELHDEALFKQSPTEDCPICFLRLPIEVGSHLYKACCGKTICSGCHFGNMIASGRTLCPFCRAPHAHSQEDEIKMLNKRVAANDAEAFGTLGESYRHGTNGLQEDHQKAFDLCVGRQNLVQSRGVTILALHITKGKAHRKM